MESCMWERVPQMYHLFEKEEIHIIVNITSFWIVKPCSLEVCIKISGKPAVSTSR